MSGKNSLKVKKIVKTVISVFLFLALIFVPAGTLNWPEAWLFFILYILIVSGVLIWLKKNNPGLLKERMSVKKDVKSWDKIIIVTYTIFLMILLVITGLDAVRFRWSNVPFVLKALGFIGFIPGIVFSLWAMVKNTYASNMVRIQENRGHKVCTTGPYRYVRHPMYVGVIILVLCFPLALGSFYAFIPSSTIAILFVLRTLLEDKTLKKELPGYKEYAKKVRYKLIPGIW
ncbi:MAG: isoprenylcysteine carboxylmethyltransferase family protein [Candidatus Aminicenantaceae bacterium]